ncbi:hypothetical protein HK405_006075 [Cladochytrium tenue]|nr:hypothetical protein HK405_006075 [Cladochytrium tenue]
MKFPNTIFAAFAVLAAVLSVARAAPLPDAAPDGAEALERRDASPEPYCWLGDSGVNCENLL